MQTQQAREPRGFLSLPQDHCGLFKGTEAQPQRVMEMLSWKKKDIAAAASMPEGSVRFDRMPGELRERMREWATAINAVAGFFKDEQKTILWFATPNPLLGGITPRDMIRLGRYRKLFGFITNALAENG